jgi:hypothetical protein
MAPELTRRQSVDEMYALLAVAVPGRDIVAVTCMCGGQTARHEGTLVSFSDFGFREVTLRDQSGTERTIDLDGGDVRAVAVAAQPRADAPAVPPAPPRLGEAVEKLREALRFGALARMTGGIDVPMPGLAEDEARAIAADLNGQPISAEFCYAVWRSPLSAGGPFLIGLRRERD